MSISSSHVCGRLSEIPDQRWVCRSSQRDRGGWRRHPTSPSHQCRGHSGAKRLIVQASSDMARLREQCRELFTIALAHGSEKHQGLGSAIVGVRPFPGYKATARITQGHFRVYTASYIETMLLIFGRG